MKPLTVDCPPSQPTRYRPKKLFFNPLQSSKLATTRSVSFFIETSVCDKLIHRHPHIYGDVKVKDASEVKKNWEKLKMKEGKRSVLEGVPKSLPAGVKAYRIQEKVRGIGFDWDNKDQVWEKVLEEIEELKKEIGKGDQDKIESEFGDVLFALINYSRFINVNPENALEKTNKRFIRRF